MAFKDNYNRGRQVVNLGAPNIFNLDSGLKIVRGNIIVEGTVTISGGSTSGSAICEGGAVNLIKMITIVANAAAGSRYRNGELVKCRPQSLLRFAISERSGKFVAEQSGSVLGNGAAGAYPIYLSIPIYFGDTTNKLDVQTALNMDKFDSTGRPIYSAVQVQIDWASSIADMFSGSDRSMTFAGTVQWKDQRIDIAADTIPIFQEDHIAQIMAASTEYVDEGMPNSGLLNQLLILEQAGGPTWQLADTILKKVEMKGPDLNLKLYQKDIRQEMLDDFFYDPATTMTGQNLLDFTSGILKNSARLDGLQHQYDVANPSGAGLDRLLVYSRRIYPLPAVQ